MAAVKIGVHLPPQRTSYTEYRQAWLHADALGVDSIWNWDHFMPLSGDPHGNHFEGWTTLAALGPQTQRAQVGCLVLCMAYRNPALLSQMATTLDHATDGKLILGLGAGWFEQEFEEFGYPFSTAGERLRNLERGIEVIKERWTLDNIGVKQVELWRDLQPGETTPAGNTTPGDPRNGKVFIANATFVDNARPDIEGLYPTTPASFRGGWGYLMLTWGLFGQGNGTYKFYAFGVDQEGNIATIGIKSVIISNNAPRKARRMTKSRIAATACQNGLSSAVDNR